jgi:hypothetical protein
MRFTTWIIVAVAALHSCGCQTLSTPKNWFGLAPKVKETEFGTPVKVSTMWTPAVLNRVGQPPTRGFGGRLYFYDANNKPIPVEGQLVVYAYNDSRPGSNHQTPDAKYAFTPEQFTTHYSATDLGASYSIWIPWDQVGNTQTEVSLVPIFTSSGGQLVIGQSSRCLLAGPTGQLSQPGTVQHGALPPPVIRRDDGVQPASFQQNPNLPPAALAPQSKPGIDTLSLRLPTSMAERLAQAPPQTDIKPSGVAGFMAAPSSLPPVAPQFSAAAPTPGATTAPPGAIPQPWFPRSPPPIRSELPRLPAPVGPGFPPASGLPLSPPSPAGLPSALPTTR